MKELILYCKSYNKDVNRAKILLDSVSQYNKDNIPFYISVPIEDVQLFKNVLGTENYTLITDEEIVGIKYNQDWKTQQIIKSSFWKLGLCHNYLMMDSDSQFIRNFYIEDFIFDKENHIPYTVLHEQKGLFSWSCKNISTLGFDPQKSFEETRKPIMEIFGRKGKIFDFGPGPVVWNILVLKSLWDEYLEPNKLTFQNLIETISSEFSWIGEWQLHKQSIGEEIIPLFPMEAPFMFFHYYQQYQEYKNMGYTLEHWSRNFIGIVLQSSSNLPLKY